jgi:hypothetical protein
MACKFVICRFKLVTLAASTAIGLTVLGRSLISASPPLIEPVAHSPAVAGPNRPALQGVASCSSVACHHAGGPAGAWRSEYTTWINSDPHANAYAVLRNEKSAQIIRNLNDRTPAAANVRCLNCHVQPGIQNAARGEQFVLDDGVGCEACHGPAERYKSEHYRWSSLPPQQKAQLRKNFGMVNTEDLLTRARTCVDCHVGNAVADVNHDLIAAGHPRLNFEFGAYHANMPHHWRDAKDKAGRPDFEARAWVIGQIVSAKAALQLLIDRADPKNGKPWPEFAEYDCFACHHNLESPSWRVGLHSARRPGELDWGDWYFTMLPQVVGMALGNKKLSSDQEENSDVSGDIMELRDEQCGRPVVLSGLSCR